jgi:hypothetical protein
MHPAVGAATGKPSTMICISFRVVVAHRALRSGIDLPHRRRPVQPKNLKDFNLASVGLGIFLSCIAVNSKYNCTNTVL